MLPILSNVRHYVPTKYQTKQNQIIKPVTITEYIIRMIKYETRDTYMISNTLPSLVHTGDSKGVKVSLQKKSESHKIK